MSSLLIRSAESADCSAIASIYNQGIAERVATFETTERTAADIATRLRLQEAFPLLVAEGDAGTTLGWAGLGEYRSRPCYAGVAEFSIYLDRDARDHGVGRALLSALIDAAAEKGFWKLLSRVFPFNEASRALCRSCGFREVGCYEKHGKLDGRWLDVIIVERLIVKNLK